MRDKSGQEPIPVSWRKVAAFRLSRHHLSKRDSSASMTSVVADMGGAQSQVLSAAQMSIWPRFKRARISDVDSAIWKDHSLARAWAMRRTMFLLPSDQLAIFVRGTTRRAGYHFRWALSLIGSKQKLDKLLDQVLEALTEPRTRSDLAEVLNKSHGYKLKTKAGGGWGNKRPVPWVQVERASIPVGQLLHVIGARDVIVSGPGDSNESTYVRADKWIPQWKDLPVERAERELLVKYLRTFGPSTLQDFALWAGLYVRDAKEIWSREAQNMAPVDVEGWKANILQSDLTELEKASLAKPVVNLLPYFDSFLLGHKSHRNIVDEQNRKKVYRNQGWVSPVVLVDGRAQGVWSHQQNKNDLTIRITPFSKISNSVSSRIREEASDLGRFLECPNVKTIIE
jgi:winged helix DNA-binding protein